MVVVTVRPDKLRRPDVDSRVFVELEEFVGVVHERLCRIAFRMRLLVRYLVTPYSSGLNPMSRPLPRH